MPRTLTPERMDDPAVDPLQLARALDYLRFVAGPLAGARALTTLLARWAPTFPKSEPVTLLDVATGAADIPIAAVRWARAHSIDLRVTAVDLHERTLAIAHERLAALRAREPELASRITLARADALRLVTPRPDDAPSSFPTDLQTFPPSSFHVVHASLFLHHLPDIQVLTVLAQLDRLASRAIVWSDLVRSPLCRALVRAATLRAPAIVKHDARVSERAAFTRREALDLARRAGLDAPRWRRSPLLYRFTITHEKRLHGRHG